MKNKIVAIKENKMTFYALCGSIVFSFMVYAYGINATVWNGVSHNKAESDMSQLENKVSDLESQYAEKRSGLSMEAAKSLGLVELKDKVYIAKASSQSLSFNNVQGEFH